MRVFLKKLRHHVRYLLDADYRIRCMSDEVISKQWHRADWVGTSGFCAKTGLCQLVFATRSGECIRLLLDRASAQDVEETLREELIAPQRNITLPQWVMSSEILQSAGSSDPGQLQEPPATSSTATEGEV